MNSSLKKSMPWIIGGIIGLVYFISTYFIDIGLCNIYKNATFCSGMTGIITIILNLPALLSMYVIGPLFKNINFPSIFGIEPAFVPVLFLDIIFGAILGFLVWKFVNFIKRK